MPDPTPTTNTAHLTAGITFTIGGTTIPGCFATPDFIFDPEMVDAGSFDDEEYLSQVAGLQKPNSLDYEFRNYGDNLDDALSSARTPDTTYVTTFPSGTVVTIVGEHVMGPSASSVNTVENFKIKIVAKSITVTYSST